MPWLTAAISSLLNTLQTPSGITYARTLHKRFPLASCGMHRKMKQLALTVSRVFMLTDFVCEFHLKVQSFCEDRPLFPRQLLPVTFKCSYFRALCGPCHTAELAPKYPEKMGRQSWYYRRQRIDRFN